MNDPARIAAQIVTGIGIFDAAPILHPRGYVQGQWVTAHIFLAVGVGMLLVLLATAMLAFLFLKIDPRRFCASDPEAE